MTRCTSCSSPAWQHVPQVLHDFPVDGVEMLTVNVCLHGDVDEKSACLTHRLHVLEYRRSAGNACSSADSPASDVADVLTNQSADMREQG